MIKLRAILLTTSLLAALPAAAQDQSKPEAAKTQPSTPNARAAEALKSPKPLVIDAARPVRLAQKDEVPKTQQSTEGRAIPGRLRNYEKPVLQDNPGAVIAPPPEAFPSESWFPVPDRWRIVDALGVGGQWWDPYNQNVIKGDRPILGTNDWFLDLTGVSDSVAELRSFPTPVSIQTTQRPGSLDVFGQADSSLYTQTFIAGADIYKGSTAFKPPEIEFRFRRGDERQLRHGVGAARAVGRPGPADPSPRRAGRPAGSVRGLSHTQCR